jgi:hypothetical protein
VITTLPLELEARTHTHTLWYYLRRSVFQSLGKAAESNFAGSAGQTTTKKPVFRTLRILEVDQKIESIFLGNNVSHVRIHSTKKTREFEKFLLT